MKGIILIILALLLVGTGFYLLTGAGGYKRLITISGLISICRPDGYDVVCFVDSAGRDGGASCVSLSLAGGTCNPKNTK